MPTRSARLARLALAGVLLGAGACAPSVRTAPESAPALANRLVLALDGVDYRDVAAARTRGLFAGFREPSRLVSTFPSISDIAWHDIFGVVPPRGYQRIYYSNAQNVVVGGALDAITPIEYEERMDLAFGTKLHHLGAYLLSGTVSRREVNVAVDRFFDITGRPTVYVYNVGPDALQHTRGDIGKYLEYLDRRLVELQAEYTRRTGKTLEIVMLSDHGHNRSLDAKFLPVVEALQAKGYRAASTLTSLRDVAFSVDGVTTGFGVFARPAVVDSVAALLAALDGVDVVTIHESDTQFRVLAANASALIERRTSESGDAYRYTAIAGDPLGYAAVADSLRAAGALDSAGFAAAATWQNATLRRRFPAALSRIVRGHTTVTLNPAPILVSLADGYRVGLGMVSIANRMRPLGGTHGALSETNSLGVLMTNFVDTHDDVTQGVREQLGGLADLRDPAGDQTTARLTTGQLVRGDRFSWFLARSESAEQDARPALELMLSSANRTWTGDAGHVRMEVRTSSRRSDGLLIATEEWPVSASAPTRRPQSLLFTMFELGHLQLAPMQLYQARIVLARSTSPGAPVSEREAATFTVRTDASGHIAAY